MSDLIEVVNFFRSRADLWIDEEFINLVVNKATTVAEPVVVKAFNPSDNTANLSMTEAEVETKLQGAHIWDESILLTTLREMIKGQPKGCEGNLLNNEHYNLFFTSSCVVGTRWSKVDTDLNWGVSAYKRDGSRQIYVHHNCLRPFSTRVFSPTRVTLGDLRRREEWEAVRRHEQRVEELAMYYRKYGHHQDDDID